MEKDKFDIGVIIGRFQLDKLHKGHLSLLDMVTTNHKKTIVFIGVSKSGLVKNQALDFPNREKMIKSEYPSVVVVPMVDMSNDNDWSNIIDQKIREVFPHGTVMMYGGRDSFIPHYFGKFKTTQISDAIKESATEKRKEIAREIRDSDDFRAGIIYAAYNKYPSALPCVDIAILNEDETQILLGRKPTETLFRFPGGHVDPTDSSLEQAAKREAHEEVGSIELSEMEYVCSRKIDDWRYREEEDKIISTLFKTKFIFGKPEAGDDIVEVKWFLIEDLVSDNSKIVYEHREMLTALLNKITINF